MLSSERSRTIRRAHARNRYPDRERRGLRAHGVRRRASREPGAKRRSSSSAASSSARSARRSTRRAGKSAMRWRRARSAPKSAASINSRCSPSTARCSMRWRSFFASRRATETTAGFFHRQARPLSIRACRHASGPASLQRQLLPARALRSGQRCVSAGLCAAAGDGDRRRRHSAVGVLSGRNRPSRDPLLLRQARRDVACRGRAIAPAALILALAQGS